MAAASSVGLVSPTAADPARTVAWSELTEDLDYQQLDQVLDVVRSLFES